MSDEEKLLIDDVEHDPEVELETEETEDEGEIVVSIDGEEASEKEEAEPAPEWVKDLRKKHRELERENRDLKAKVSAANGMENAPAILPKKPKLDDDGIDYDQDKYEAELDSWYAKKKDFDDKQRENEKAEAERQNSFNAKLESYNQAREKIRVPDFEDAEGNLINALDRTQQGIIIDACENPALLVYALGRNQGKLNELAAIKNPVQFAYAVSKLENTMKVTKKTAAAEVEKMPPSFGGKSVASADKNLDRLRAEAEKTGDYSKVMQYKKQLKAKK